MPHLGRKMMRLSLYSTIWFSVRQHTPLPVLRIKSCIWADDLFSLFGTSWYSASHQDALRWSIYSRRPAPRRERAVEENLGLWIRGRMHISGWSILHYTPYTRLLGYPKLSSISESNNRVDFGISAVSSPQHRSNTVQESRARDSGMKRSIDTKLHLRKIR
jgi:hypothetical protein